MLPTFCPPTIWIIAPDFYRKPSILAAEGFLKACYRKAMTPKRLWTLLFPNWVSKDVALYDRKYVNHVHVQTKGVTKFSVFLKRVSLLNPRVRTNFVAFPLARTTGKSLEVRFDFGPRPGFSKQLFGSSREGIEFNVRNVPVTPTPSIFPKVLPYKWGAYCRTNGRRTAVQMGGVLQSFPFFEAQKPGKCTAIQMGGVLPYKLEVYCRTFWASCRGWGFRNIAQIGLDVRGT